MAEPRQLGHGLGRIVTSMTSSRGPMVQVLEHWDDLVGEAVARHARPKRLNDGVLVVEVDDPSWATQLRFLSEQLTNGLNERLGSAAIVRVDLKVVSR